MPEEVVSEDLESKTQTRPQAPVCQACAVAESRYRCPACSFRSCSLACVKAHKASSGCTGKRARTELVTPLNSFTDHVVLRDFGLLEDVDSAVDRAHRDLSIQTDDMKLFQPKRHRQRIALARACAGPDRQTRLILAPFGMSLARSNSSRVIGGEDKGRGKGKKGKGKGKDKGKGKGKDKGEDGVQSKGSERDDSKPAYIVWRVDWHFGHSGQVLTDKSLAEHEVVGKALQRFLKNSCHWGATRHLLLPYAEAGLDKLEVFLHQPRRTKEALLPFELHDKRTDEPAESTEPCEGKSAEPDYERFAGDWQSSLPRPPAPPPPQQAPSDEEEEDADEEEEEEEEEQAAETIQGDEGDADAEHVPFVKLDKSKTLRENLMARAVIEYPVLHVALPQECGRFEKDGALQKAAT